MELVSHCKNCDAWLHYIDHLYSGKYAVSADKNARYLETQL